ncbi:MAG: hypothetical protein HYY45_20935 [Deltaproteobacteria bacterium]|nr:hypothetical protein [Deltaproteobacteria bacterium]
MNKRLRLLTAICFTLAAFFLLAVPVWADSVDEKIKALENELTRLKSEQMELKKEAVAAAAALPEFTYRRGSGLTIAAADKSWSMNFTWTWNLFNHSHPGGKPVITTETGPVSGDVIRSRTNQNNAQFTIRRNRPEWTFCWADCFYEMSLSMDMAEGADETVANARDNNLSVHFENWNPYLPRLNLGTRIPGSVYLGRSSSSGFSSEHSLVPSSNSTTSTGSSSGIALWWEEIPVGSGDFTFLVRWLDRGVGVVLGELRDTNKKAANLYFQTRPFKNTKNMWLQGITFAVGSYLQPIDKRANSVNELEDGFEDDSGDTIELISRDVEEPTRLRMRTHERLGRITVFDANRIGGGLHHMTGPSLRWQVGPYQLSGVWLADRWQGKRDSFRGVRGDGWKIENGFWLWSPKGPFTGSSSTAGTVALGWSFEREDGRCNSRFVGSTGGCVAGPGQDPHQNAFINRELDLYYYISRGLRLGFWWNWWKAHNTPTETQVAVGCKRNIAAAEAGKESGRECSWHTISFGLQYAF